MSCPARPFAWRFKLLFTTWRLFCVLAALSAWWSSTALDLYATLAQQCLCCCCTWYALVSGVCCSAVALQNYYVSVVVVVCVPSKTSRGDISCSKALYYGACWWALPFLSSLALHCTLTRTPLHLLHQHNDILGSYEVTCLAQTACMCHRAVEQS